MIPTCCVAKRAAKHETSRAANEALCKEHREAPMLLLAVRQCDLLRNTGASCMLKVRRASSSNGSWELRCHLRLSCFAMLHSVLVRILGQHLRKRSSRSQVSKHPRLAEAQAGISEGDGFFEPSKKQDRSRPQKSIGVARCAGRRRKSSHMGLLLHLGCIPSLAQWS